MARLLIALAIVLVASTAAALLRRRRVADAPTQVRREAPTQLDRADFVRPEAEWLIVVFTSATCHTCADTVVKARVLASEAVAFEEVEYSADRERHQRYSIDAVPTLVVADSSGVVQVSFLGRVTATDLWAAVAEAREPGSGPEGGCRGPD
jgi:thioredoxin-related protein